MPSKLTPNCGGCKSTINDGANWVKKCTWCCKQYCNNCINGGCPHCGKSGEDWTQKVVSQKEYENSF
ncbi:MAG: hypothetical protein ACI9J4_001299 [Paraglaciecola sp.]|jgi:hypothetical protein